LATYPAAAITPYQQRRDARTSSRPIVLMKQLASLPIRTDGGKEIEPSEMSPPHKAYQLVLNPKCQLPVRKPVRVRNGPPLSQFDRRSIWGQAGRADWEEIEPSEMSPPGVYARGVHRSIRSTGQLNRGIGLRLRHGIERPEMALPFLAARDLPPFFGPLI
jgi:hypothetical protein